VVVAGGFPVPSSAVSLSEQLSLQDLTIMVGDPITLMVVVPTMVMAIIGDPTEIGESSDTAGLL
jgi:hypothetical protein